ncbi:MAG: aminotransferase class V-fold PLP-dependent enzyme [Verrucomicrobiota bacterium]
MKLVTDGEIIYLDNNATTQLDPAVVEKMMPFLVEFYGNPSSGYQFGARVRKAIDLAREQVAAMLGCEPTEIVFTSCGTESNNAAINAAVQFEPRGKHIITSAVEHSAVRRHCEDLAKYGCEVTFLGIDVDGNVDLAELKQAIRAQTAIVSLMWANNETGILFPVEEAAQICREKGVTFHTDAVQAAGKIPIQLRDTAINFLSISAHKFHGPKGVGILYVNRRARFRPTIIGGSQENGRRAGTENVASIVGMGQAAERAVECLPEEETRVRAMRDRFEKGISERIKGALVNGARAARLPNTSSVSFDGIESNGALLLLDRHRLCCSAGSACKTGSNDGSHVLRAMALSEERIRGSLRFSFGRFNKDTDLDRALEIVSGVMEKLHAFASPGKPRPVEVG